MARAFGIPATGETNRAREIAAAVEDLGYTTIWANDTPSADGILTVAHMADATANLRVGVGVVAADRRPAAEIVSVIRDLEIPLDRLVLGLGSGASPTPIRTVRTAVAELRNAVGPQLRIAVAAMGPQMCRLAGEIADVVLFNWMVPHRLAWAVDQATEGAARSGRDGLPETAAYVRAAIDERAGDRIEAEANKYNRYPAYERHFRAMGSPLRAVGVTDETPGLLATLADYDSVLDEVVVRALPTSESVASTMAVAEALAPAQSGT